MDSDHSIEEQFWPDDIVRYLLTFWMGWNTVGRFGLVSHKLSKLIWHSRKHMVYNSKLEPWMLKFRGLESISVERIYDRQISAAFSRFTEVAHWIAQNASSIKTIGAFSPELPVLKADYPDQFEVIRTRVNEVSVCWMVSEFAINTLVEFTNLTKLSINECILDSKLIARLAQGARSVTHLSLGLTGLSNADLEELGKMERLTHLAFSDFRGLKLPYFSMCRWDREQSRNRNENAIIAVLPDILRIMPAHIGINFFLVWGHAITPFVELAMANTNMQVAEELVLAGAKLDMLDFDDSNTIFMTMLQSCSSHSLASRPLIQYALEKQIVDPGLLLKKNDCMQSIFHEILELDRVPLSFVESLFAVQLPRARKMHPENQQFFLRNSAAHTLPMRAIRRHPVSSDIFQYLWSLSEQLGFSASDVDLNKGTIAHHACRRMGSTPADLVTDLKDLRRLGVDINARDYYGQKVFHLTAANKTDAILECADELGIVLDFQDVSTTTMDTLSMLSVACRNNNTSSVRSLLRVATSASMLGDVKGFTPLHAAAAALNAPLSKENLIAIVEQKDRLQLDLNPALLTSEVYFWLLPPASGAGVTPLMITVVFNYAEAAAVLLDAGASIHVVHPTGSNLFHYAAERANIPILRSLCDKLTAQDRHLLLQVNRSGFTPLLYIGYKLGMRGFEPENAVWMAQILLDAAGPLAKQMVNIRDSRDRPVYFYGKRRKAEPFCALLRRYGAEKSVD